MLGRYSCIKAESSEQEIIIRKNPKAIPSMYLKDRLYPKERPIEALLIVLGPGEKVVTKENMNSETISICIPNPPT